ncbi:hypothetical protein ACTWPT_22970 [Nonomuraea sp. 3N208]
MPWLPTFLTIRRGPLTDDLDVLSDAFGVFHEPGRLHVRGGPRPRRRPPA